MIKSESCMHLHLVCINCDMKDGYCHCFDGGMWICQDCNKLEYEADLKDAIQARLDTLSYISPEHERKLKSEVKV